MTEPVDSTPITADELAGLYIPGKSSELIRGRVVVREPPSTEHGRIQARLAYFVTDFVWRGGLGVVFGQDTGFKIRSDPDTVRAADVAFLRQDRANAVPRRGYAAIAPDFVAEILSPGDRPGEVLAKVAEWLDAGVALVWVVDPERHVAQVYRSDGNLTIVGPDGRLDGEDVIPGFSCALTDVIA
jgi:Uma2 family endonuclease